MPELDLGLLGKTKGPIRIAYDWRETALYALAVGAGLDEGSLLYEAWPGGMRALPSFVVVPSYKAWPDLGGVTWPLMIHGEQTIRLHQPLPPSGEMELTGRVANIFDKGKGALLEVRVSGSLVGGGPLFEAQWNIFYIGAGGFGGEKGPSAARHEPPDTAPDWEITYQVPETQAALYRLLGDLNPLHIDPQAAAQAGFQRPILHGLCTYGYATRALVNGPLQGDPDRLHQFAARFANPVYPGDAVTFQIWRQDQGYLIQGATPQGVVLQNGLAQAR